MANGGQRTPLRQVRTLFGVGALGGATDRQLLERFNGRRDPSLAEAAFETIVARHGPMVLGICRRVLADPHDADDAFQATFLVLVRRGGSIARPELLGNWLYGVAYRTAREARARAVRRRAKEASVGERVGGSTSDDDTWRDLQPILDEELSRLPEKYRVPVVFCDLEGLARSEVARRLNLPEGTVSSRLARARALLRERLCRRGVALSAAALAASLSRDAAAAAVPTALADLTVRTAARVAVGDTVAAAAKASVASLAEGVIKLMFLSKLKTGAVVLLALGLTVTGAGVVAQSYPTAGGSNPPLEAQPGLAQAIPDGPDRLKTLEDKLDRLINALEGHPGATRALNRSPAPETIPQTVSGVVANGPQNAPQMGIRLSNQFPQRSDSERLDDLERRMHEVERKLDEVHRVVFRGGQVQQGLNLPGNVSETKTTTTDTRIGGQPGASPRP